MNDNDRPIFTMDTMRTDLELKDGYRIRLAIAHEALTEILQNTRTHDEALEIARDTLPKISE